MNGLSRKLLSSFLFGFSLFLLVGCKSAVSRPAKPVHVMKVPAHPDGLEVLRAPSPSASFEHDKNSFTQGLLFHKGALFESTGRNGQSKVRKLKLESGTVEAEVEVPEEFFAEGLAFLDGSFYQLTWQAGVCLIYDEQLAPQGQLLYGTEGWGLTVQPEKKQLIFSDGSPQLRFLSPKNLITQEKRLVVDGAGQEVKYLNELEWVRGEIWANVWMSDVVCRIDPETGKVKSWIKFEKLVQENQTSDEDVLNGLAYDPESDSLWVTGKLWTKIYRFDDVSKIFFQDQS